MHPSISACGNLHILLGHKRSRTEDGRADGWWLGCLHAAGGSTLQRASSRRNRCVSFVPTFASSPCLEWRHLLVVWPCIHRIESLAIELRSSDHPLVWAWLVAVGTDSWSLCMQTPSPKKHCSDRNSQPSSFLHPNQTNALRFTHPLRVGSKIRTLVLVRAIGATCAVGHCTSCVK